MSGRAVIVGLIDAGATRASVARVVMLVAGVLLSVTAWSAASAWADTPLQWRIVGGSGGGTAFGSDQTLTTPPVFSLGGQPPDQTFMTALAPAPAPPPPTLGQTANVTPTSGIVLVKLPAGPSPYSLARPAVTPIPSKGLGFIPITQARQVPIGSEIDSLRGTLNLVVSNGKPFHTQEAHLRGGIYVVTQTATGPDKGLTTFTLKENAFAGAPTYSSCTAKQAGAHAAALPFSKKPTLSSSVLQTLRATDNHGQFRTVGRFSSATVRGTDWGVKDRCDGTLTLVHRGTVDVLDFATRKTIVVHAGHSFLAAAVAARKHTKTKTYG